LDVVAAFPAFRAKRKFDFVGHLDVWKEGSRAYTSHPSHKMMSRSRDASVCDLGGLSVEPQKKTEPSAIADITRSLLLVSMLVLAFAGSAAATASFSS
jgi:hypothetical protein